MDANTRYSETWRDPAAWDGQWGYYKDNETGLLWLGHRYYDSSYAGVRNVTAYDAFGSVHGNCQFGSFTPKTTFPNIKPSPFGFGGQHGYYTDTQTGLSLLTHRYYDAGTGRFVNRDPIGYKGGINLYGLAGNNPVNRSDPQGTSFFRRQPPNPEGDKWYPQNWSQAWARAKNHWNAIPANFAAMGQNVLGVVQALDEDECGCGPAPTKPSIKRGPKAKGTGPHNAKITERIEQLKKEHPDWEHQGGGDRTEETIQTPGGFKSSRRPDITFRRPNGTLYRENVGKTFRDGSPIRREKRALDDIERQTGTRPAFTPYDR